MEGETFLDYGALEGQVREAIVEENIEALNISGLPIEIAYPDIDQVSNDEYVMIRRESFGASDSSVLLGVNPFNTLPELIIEKASPTISAEEREVGEKVAVRKGKDLEPLIIAKFEKYFNQHTFKPKDMYRFKDYPYLSVNFDGVTGSPEQYIPAEIKVVTMYGEKHYNPLAAFFNELEGFKALPEDVSTRNMSIQNKAAHYGIPPYYYTQLQQQLFALNAPFGHLSVLFDKTWRFYSFHIWRDEAVIRDLIINGYKAWEKVLLTRRTSGWDAKGGLDSILTELQQSTKVGKAPVTSGILFQEQSNESKDY